MKTHLALQFLPLLSLVCVSCVAGTHDQDPSPAPVRDIHSFSEPERVRVTHVALDLELDFEEELVRGVVRLDLDRKEVDAPLTLDMQGLVVESVLGSDGSARAFSVGATSAGLGAPLVIELGPDDEWVTVAYQTGKGCEALQWLAPQQTAGGEHPFLFTQGQAVMTRSWIPLQDSPGVRVTYEARVRAPRDLTVVMSAIQGGRDEQGRWQFNLERPIPPYLIALACGRLVSRAISTRCAVWAEPETVAAAHAEFEDTEAMIASAEELYGEYLWGRYDLLVLPPAFPYGGMENPLLTFCTPTVIAGDKSLVSLIAHELAHSWSGNLVTNATWSDFWLNEGFTVYFEKRIMERVFGQERAHMEMQLDRADLEGALAGMQEWETVLHIDLAGRHPDDGFSIVPYNKGALFLRRLEEIFGRVRFDAFLSAWFSEHAFESVTSADFEAFLEERLLSSDPVLASGIDVAEWIHGSGLPADAPLVRTDSLARVDAILAALGKGLAPREIDTSGWVTQQWLRLLAGLRSIESVDMVELDEAFAFTASGNSEILCAWLILAIERGYAGADDRQEEFLMTVGRRKFLQPLYTALMASEQGAQRARRIYAAARPRYHSVSTGTLDGIVTDA